MLALDCGSTKALELFGLKRLSFKEQFLNEIWAQHIGKTSFGCGVFTFFVGVYRFSGSCSCFAVINALVMFSLWPSFS